MSPQVTNIIILVIAAVVPVYLIIRLPRLGYLLGVLAVSFLFIFRDALIIGLWEMGVYYFIRVPFHFLSGLSYCTLVYGLKELFVLLRNRKRGIRATRRKKVALVIVGAAVLLIVPVWWLCLGLAQCYAYHRVVSEPSWAARLGVKPTKVELPKNQDVPNFSLWYAEVFIHPELISSVECPFNGHVEVECDGVGFLFVKPISQTYEEFGQTFVQNEGLFSGEFPLQVDVKRRSVPSREELMKHPLGRLTIEMIEEPYRRELKVVNTMPKTYHEIFFMKRVTFIEYITLAFAKVLRPHVEYGVGIFETENVCGIIHFGMADKPGTICAQVFSKESNISQGIHALSESPEKGKKELLLLLASYRFNISELPGKDELSEMVISEVSKHEKFKKKEEPQKEE